MRKLNRDTGTYRHCTDCKIKHNCCCDFEEGIDNIVVTLEEKKRIINAMGRGSESYFSKINEQAYNILSVNGVCPFYKDGCTIYDIRPSDCRLFPYDLKEIGGKYYLIQYDLPCGSNKVNENVDEIIDVLSEIIETYTDKKIEEKVNKLQFKVIKEIKIK